MYISFVFCHIRWINVAMSSPKFYGQNTNKCKEFDHKGYQCSCYEPEASFYNLFLDCVKPLDYQSPCNNTLKSDIDSQGHAKQMLVNMSLEFGQKSTWYFHVISWHSGILVFQQWNLKTKKRKISPHSKGGKRLRFKNKLLNVFAHWSGNINKIREKYYWQKGMKCRQTASGLFMAV